MAADRRPGDARTAVVIVHGMGEKRPLETLDGIVRTALCPTGSRWNHHARPTEITETYEASRFVAPTKDGSVDFYEYNWPYLMTANKYAGVAATAMRLFVRRPGNVPDTLFGIWRAVWSVVVALLLVVPVLFALGYLLNTDVPGWIIGIVFSAIVLVFWFGLYRMAVRVFVNGITTSFVDAVRYLDGAPSSYAARRAIRKGLVDLLHSLHDGRYPRVVVVAHSVGALICYDALTAFWADVHEGSTDPAPLVALAALEKSADRLAAGEDALDEYQHLQSALADDLRHHGNPWRVTDFVTLGAPLALADFLLTRPALASGCKHSDGATRHELFARLVRRGAVVSCPPRSESLCVDDDEASPASYRSADMPGALGSQCPFAVTRWTNMWFPVVRGRLGGDWFAGALRPLFGPGIRDIAVAGNQPERLKRGSAHGEYLRHPERGDEGDVAWHLRRVLDV